MSRTNPNESPSATSALTVRVPNLFLRARGAGNDPRTGFPWTTGDRWSVRDSMRFTRFVPQDSNPSSCWAWQGAIDKYGYGKFTARGRTLKAHRAAYEMRRGPIPPSLTIDHMCENKACVNPAHLDVATAAENTRRSARDRRLSCGREHPWTEQTTRWRSNGRRACRTCESLRRARRWRPRP